MAEFKDAKLWMKIAFLLAMLSMVQELFGFGLGMGRGFDSGSVEAFLIIGFLCFITAIGLILCLIFLDELNGNKIAQIVFIVLILVAGVATVIGVALWGGRFNDNNSDPPTYSTMLGCCAGLLAILSGIFAILDVVGVKG